MNEFKENIEKFSNEKLCEIIATNRYLGNFREMAIMSMEELARRRSCGEEFNYEEKIKAILDDLPKINIDLKTIIKINKFL